MSRERRLQGGLPAEAAGDFNEARLHEPGEARGLGRGRGRHPGTSMRPGSMSRERQGPWGYAITGVGTSMRPGSMSRERRRAHRPRPCVAPDFNEARLHEPGEAAPGRGRRPRDRQTSMRPGSMSRERLGVVTGEGRAGGTSMRPGSMSRERPKRSTRAARGRPDFNEARLHEPGEAP